MPFLGTRGAASSGGFGLLAKTGPAVGQAIYTVAGTYTWVCPSGVTSVCVVCVGSGRNGVWHSSGEGGSLAYTNNISVTPGQSYQVRVASMDGGNRDFMGTGNASWFINASTLYAAGNRSETNVGQVTNRGGVAWTSGGGGGGGYSGEGGGSQTAGSGGGGGGGGHTDALGTVGPEGESPYYTYVRGGGGGGGVGLFGQGANGAAGAVTSNGIAPGGGNGSTTGSGGYGYQGGGGGGGFYGAGGGMGGYEYDFVVGDVVVTNPGGSSYGGAVRIIWGVGRSFPSTNTGNF